MDNKLLQWASQLQSIAQAGLTYSTDKYDLERFGMIRNISVEILNDYTGIEHDKIVTHFASETGYQTPKVDIRASVFKDSRILMVKEKSDGDWALPGEMGRC
jgi:hydrolase of X-linked nucleoside diphosphate